MLRAYTREEGCSITDGQSQMRTQTQTQSFGTHKAQRGEMYTQLGKWCSVQKIAKKNMDKIAMKIKPKGSSRISKEQIEILDSIGFKW